MTHVLVLLQLLVVIGTFIIAPGVYAQGDLPQGDPFSEQVISPTVEVLVGVGNFGITGFNAWQLRSNRRNDFVAGLGIISGGVGIALGLHEAASYPTFDLIAGAAAVISGGIAMLSLRSRSGMLPVRLPFVPHPGGRLHFYPSSPQTLGPGARVVIHL